MTGARRAFAAIILLAGLIIAARRFTQFGWGTDFEVFARTVSWPLGLLYHDPGPMPFLYPPPAILLFRPFAMLPSGYVIWALVSLLAFAISVSAVSDRRISISSLCSPAAVGGLILGQAPMLLAAALFVGLTRKPFVGGVLWGLVASIKPHLMVFAPVALAVRKDWTMLAGMAAGATAAFIVSSALFGFGLWCEWLDAVTSFGKKVAVTEVAVWSITPSGKAAILGLPAAPFLVAGIAIAASTVIVAAKKVQDDLLIALIVAAGIVASPYANTHDTIALIPACVAMLFRGPWWAAIPAAMIFVGTPFVVLIGLMAGLAVAGLWAIRSNRIPAQN